jgi:lipoyl(octanoyl) transferase
MPWRLLNFQRYNAFENMAIDEAIFRETIENKIPPTIRFYGWRPAAVSVGYFQDIEKEVNIEKCRAEGVDIVRRLSGGKAVLHCDEITYSVVAAKEEKIFPANISDTYKLISNCLAYGLACLGIDANLAPAGRAPAGSDFKSYCFSVPSRNELLVSGRKICGSAQMRTNNGFLQHGSILVNFDPARTASFLLPARNEEQIRELNNSVAAINSEVLIPVDEKEICANLRNGFAKILEIEITEGKLSEKEEDLKVELVNKYSDWCWNRRRGKDHFKISD